MMDKAKGREAADDCKRAAGPRFVIASALLIAAVLCWLPLHGARAQNPIETLRSSSVRIVSDAGIGTGYVIDGDGSVVTNRHVLAGADEARVETAGGESYSLTGIAGEDTLRDLLILRVPQISGVIAPLRFRADPPAHGERVFLLGNETDTRFSPLAGAILSLDSNPVYGPFIKFGAAIMQGYSGGALVDSAGQVLATVVAFTDDAEHGRVGYAIPNLHLQSIRRDTRASFRDWAASAHAEDAGLLRKLLKNAQTAMRGKRYAQAISWYQQLFSLFPLETPVEAFYNHALCCYSTSDFETARRGLEHYCREAPEDSDGPFLLGLTNESLGDFAAAAAAFGAALRLKPDTAEFLYHLGIAHFKNGDKKAACEAHGRLSKSNRKLAENLRLQIGPCSSK